MSRYAQRHRRGGSPPTAPPPVELSIVSVSPAGGGPTVNVYIELSGPPTVNPALANDGRFQISNDDGTGSLQTIFGVFGNIVSGQMDIVFDSGGSNAWTVTDQPTWLTETLVPPFTGGVS